MNEVVNIARTGKDIAARRFLNNLRRSELNPFPLIERKQKGPLLPKILRLFFMLRSTDSTLCNKIKDDIKQYYREPNQRLRGRVAGDLSKYF